MTKRLLDFDAFSGVKTFHDYDEATQQTSLTYVQDVSAALDANKAAANHASGPLGDMVHVASIPVSVQLKWLIDKGIDVLNPDHKQAVAKLLDDPEWRYLKVRNIILGKV
jgi:hypothetical protein